MASHGRQSSDMRFGAMGRERGSERERDRDRDRDRYHRHRSHSRERDPSRRDRERERERRDRRSRSRSHSRSRSPRGNRRRSPVYMAGPSGKHDEAPMEELTAEEKQMAEVMGFASFHTTKGKLFFSVWGATCSDGKKHEELPDYEEYREWLNKKMEIRYAEKEKEFAEMKARYRKEREERQRRLGEKRPADFGRTSRDSGYREERSSRSPRRRHRSPSRGRDRDYEPMDKFRHRDSDRSRPYISERERPFGNDRDRPFSSDRDRPYSNDRDRPYSNDRDRHYSSDRDRPYISDRERPYSSDRDRSYSNDRDRLYNSERNRPYNNDRSRHEDEISSFSNRDRSPRPGGRGFSGGSNDFNYPTHRDGSLERMSSLLGTKRSYDF